MLKRNSFNVHWKFGACQKWEPAGRIGDFGNFLNGFAKSPRVLRTVLNIEWVQFVLKNCEMLHFVRGLYVKNSASYYCMKCWLHAPRVVGKILLSKLVERKNSAWFVFQEFVFQALLHPFGNHRWSLQSDWLRAMWFIHESHYFVL